MSFRRDVLSLLKCALRCTRRLALTEALNFIVAGAEDLGGEADGRAGRVPRGRRAGGRGRASVFFFSSGGVSTDHWMGVCHWTCPLAQPSAAAVQRYSPTQWPAPPHRAHTPTPSFRSHSPNFPPFTLLPHMAELRPPPALAELGALTEQRAALLDRVRRANQA